MIADLVEVNFFDEIVPLRDPFTTDYIEVPGKNQINFSRGVRVITERQLQRVLRLAGTRQTADTPPATNPSISSKGSRPLAGRARQDHIAAIFEYSTSVALEFLESQHPSSTVTVMPDNNPGYDILVEGDSPIFVEVKGTSSGEVVFHLTESQHRFSKRHGEHFMLIVIYGIDLAARTHEIRVFNGPVDSDTFLLEPVGYVARLP